MKYFTYAEMIKSANAIQKRIWNATTHENEENIRELVEKVLDPLREKYGKPINVTSGFRNPQVNRACNGEYTSQHLRGEAADISVGNAKLNLELAKLIIQSGNYDQLILEEVGKKDLQPQWLHVSWKREGYNRHEVRKKVKNVTGYPVITKEEVLNAK